MDRISELEDEIVELRFALKESRDKQLIYLDILTNIDTSLKDLFEGERENERFNFGDEVDYRECLVNLDKALKEYKRIYRITF
jgi:hypothetical protein